MAHDFSEWRSRLVTLSRQDGDCRIWISAINGDGYGVFTYIDVDGRRRSMGAHKAAFLASGGILSDGEVVRHLTCHQTLCIEPQHLAAGTQRQNLVEDRKDSGTYFNRGHRITDDERILRLAAVARGMTPAEYAQAYGVSLNAAYQWFRRNRTVLRAS